MRKEFAIGETFQYGLVKLKVVECESNSCEGCFFDCRKYECDYNEHFIGSCFSKQREDNKNVIFVKIED